MPLIDLWNYYLYTPLLNLLIFLYETIGLHNLGLAVVWLTIFIRLILIILSLIVERNREHYFNVNQQIPEIQRTYRDDSIALRTAVRQLLKKQRINHWAPALLLGLQGLVLVLLYRVFLGGIHFDTINPFLYAWVPHPTAAIDTTFLGIFDVAQRNALIAFIIAIFLYIDIWADQRSRSHLLTRSDLLYRLLFPFFTFIALWLLPSVKAIFILTSIIFSVFFHYFRIVFVRIFFKSSKEEKAKEAAHAEYKTISGNENPLDALRKL